MNAKRVAKLVLLFLVSCPTPVTVGCIPGLGGCSLALTPNLNALANLSALTSMSGATGGAAANRSLTTVNVIPQGGNAASGQTQGLPPQPAPAPAPAPKSAKPPKTTGSNPASSTTTQGLPNESVPKGR